MFVKGKSTLSWVLSFLMCLSSFNLPVFSEETIPETGTESTSQEEVVEAVKENSETEEQVIAFEDGNYVPEADLADRSDLDDDSRDSSVHKMTDEELEQWYKKDASYANEKMMALEFNSSDADEEYYLQSVDPAGEIAEKADDDGSISGPDEPNINDYYDAKPEILEDLPGICGVEVTWSFDSLTGTLTISGKGEMTNYANAESAPWYIYKDEIINIYIEDGIQSLGHNSITGYPKLESVDIGKDVIYIGKNVFADCENLSNLEFSGDESSIKWFDINDAANNEEAFRDSQDESVVFSDPFKRLMETFVINVNAEETDEETESLNEEVQSENEEGLSEEELLPEDLPEENTSDEPVNIVTEEEQDQPETEEKLSEGNEEIEPVEEGPEAVQKESSADTELSEEEYSDAAEEEEEEHVRTAEVVTGTCGDGISWAYDPDTKVLSITGTGEMSDYNAASSTPWAEYSDVILEASVGDGITCVGNYALAGLTKINKITLSNTITSIGFRAFYQDTELTQINIPLGWSSVRSTSTTIDATTSGKIFEGCQNLTEITVPEGMIVIPSYGFNGCDYLTKVNLPSTLTEIKNHTFYQCSKITAYALPDGITRIGKSAFYGNSSLTEITVPDGVTYIDHYAFDNNAAITTIRLPDTVESMGYMAFAECPNLESINIPKSWTKLISSNSNGTENADYMGKLFYGDQKLLTVTVEEGVTELPAFAFNGCNYLTKVNLPSTLTEIKNHTFYECSKITEYSLPSGITRIGKSAFYGNNSLTEITVPDGVTYIDHYAFDNNASITTIRLPDTVESMGYMAFAECPNLESINIPKSWTKLISSNSNGTENVDYMGKLFYGDQKLLTVTVEEGVTELPAFAFNGCNYLTGINLPSTLTALLNQTFYNCERLKDIDIPDKVTRIGKSAFLGCKALEQLEVPDGVTTIGPYAFENCTSLAMITIPDSIESFGFRAFANCSKLTSFHIPANWKENSNSSTSNANVDNSGQLFNGCSSLKSIAVPDNITALPAYAFNGCDCLETIVLPDTLTVIPHHAFYNCSALKDPVIPSGVTEIHKSAFYNCNSIDVLTIPDQVNTLYEYSFAACDNLETVVLPDGLEKIYYYAFGECQNLTKINIPLGWKTTGTYADRTPSESDTGYIFYDCSKLQYVKLPDGMTELPAYAFNQCNYLKTVILPDSLKTLGQYCFANCSSLFSLKLPAGVATIPSYAFKKCTTLGALSLPNSISNIEANSFIDSYSGTTVFYPGNDDQWSGIIGTANLSSPNLRTNYTTTYSEKDFLQKFDGEYDGNHNNIVVRRHFTMNLSDITSEGNVCEIAGKIVFSPAPSADPAYGANGSYFFSGIVDLSTGAMSFQGKTWIKYPTEYSNFEFVTFDGFLSDTKDYITGINSNISSRTYLAYSIGSTASGNFTVKLEENKIYTDILKDSKSYMKDDPTVVSLHATYFDNTNPNQNDYNYEFLQVQSGISFAAQAGSLLDIQPAVQFKPLESVYVVVKDAAGEFISMRKLKLLINDLPTLRISLGTDKTRLTVYEETKPDLNIIPIWTESASYYYQLSNNAAATIDGNTYYTDKKGVAIIPTPDNQSVEIHKNGYAKVTKTAEQIKQSSKIYLNKLQDGMPSLNAVYIDGVDVLHEDYGIDVYSSLKTTIKVDVDWNGDSYGKIQLMQSSRSIDFSASSNELSLVLKDNGIRTDEEVYIAVYNKSGKHVKKQLKLSGTNNDVLKAMEGLKFDFGGGMSLTLPDGIPLVGGKEVKYAPLESLIPFSFAVEDGKVYVALGLDLGEYKKNITKKNQVNYKKKTEKVKRFVQKTKEVYYYTKRLFSVKVLI